MNTLPNVENAGDNNPAGAPLLLIAPTSVVLPDLLVKTTDGALAASKSAGNYKTAPLWERVIAAMSTPSPFVLVLSGDELQALEPLLKLVNANTGPGARRVRILVAAGATSPDVYYDMMATSTGFATYDWSQKEVEFAALVAKMQAAHDAPLGDPEAVLAAAGSDLHPASAALPTSKRFGVGSALRAYAADPALSDTQEV